MQQKLNWGSKHAFRSNLFASKQAKRIFTAIVAAIQATHKSASFS
jgi:hypothetical protein